MTEKLTDIGRLAMRIEGDRWTAYYAKQHTMDGAVWLGSVALVTVETRQRKRQFIDFMTGVVGDLIEEEHGQRPVWSGPKTAPDHERR